MTGKTIQRWSNCQMMMSSRSWRFKVTEIFGVVISKSAIRDNFQALLGRETTQKELCLKFTDVNHCGCFYTARVTVLN